MYLHFREQFDLPVDDVFPYFEAPSEWAKLYGVAKPTRRLKGDWFAIPLAKFPFPLVARNVEFERNRRVRWEFGGFWRGVGEVNFSPEGGKTLLEGFEYIVPHGLGPLAPLAERLFMKKEFERIWAIGWSRIRKGHPAAFLT